LVDRLSADTDAVDAIHKALNHDVAAYSGATCVYCGHACWCGDGVASEEFLRIIERLHVRSGQLVVQGGSEVRANTTQLATVEIGRLYSYSDAVSFNKQTILPGVEQDSGGFSHESQDFFTGGGFLDDEGSAVAREVDDFTVDLDNRSGG